MSKELSGKLKNVGVQKYFTPEERRILQVIAANANSRGNLNTMSLGQIANRAHVSENVATSIMEGLRMEGMIHYDGETGLERRIGLHMNPKSMDKAIARRSKRANGLGASIQKVVGAIILIFIVFLIISSLT